MFRNMGLLCRYSDIGPYHGRLPALLGIHFDSLSEIRIGCKCGSTWSKASYSSSMMPATMAQARCPPFVAVSIDLGSFFVGVLTIRALLFESILGPLILGNSQWSLAGPHFERISISGPLRSSPWIGRGPSKVAAEQSGLPPKLSKVLKPCPGQPPFLVLSPAPPMMCVHVHTCVCAC